MDTIPPNLSATDQHTAQILEGAVSTGDLTTVTTILSQWPTQPSSESFNVSYGPKPANIPYDQDLWPFALVLYTAIDKNRAEIVSYVLSSGLKPQPSVTVKALDTGSIDIFQALFDHGWDIDAPLAPNMCPPLWFVCPSILGPNDPLSLVLLKGWFVTNTHKHLSYAITNEPLVHWFLSQGASPDACAPQNARTPVSSACANAPLHILKLFYAHGASHFDALQSAAESPAEGRLEVLKFLLGGGADVNAVKWKHNEEEYTTFALFGLGTALHYAAKGGYVDRVELLLRWGANVDALDSNGRTPLEVAREHARADIVTILTT